jgi:RNA polymerase sigma factor (sigma-70 family)
MDGDDDERLLERIRKGDAESFGVLYDRTWRWLLSFVIVPRVGGRDAEDVLSETYRTALSRIGSYEWRGVGLLHWLSSIARRKALERVRQGGREDGRRGDPPDLAALPDGAPSAEAEMIRLEALRELKGRVAATLTALPPRYAEALRLRLLEGRERAECAALLTVSPATFDVVLHRATKAFEKAWGTPR